MATLLSDNFDRANSTTVIGAPQTGPAPVVQGGVGGISSNMLYCTTATLIVTYDLGTPDVELSFVGNSLSSNWIYLVLGYASATDNYLVGFIANSAVTLLRGGPGGYATLYSSSVKFPAVNGSVCKAHCRGGVIRVYVDGVLVIRWAVDAPITSNVHGVRIAAATNPKLDNLLGTDAPTIIEPTLAGGLQSAGLTYAGGPAVVPPSFIYRGRDTKIQDDTAGA